MCSAFSVRRVGVNTLNIYSAGDNKTSVGPQGVLTCHKIFHEAESLGVNPWG